jgi:hypothetical protein
MENVNIADAKEYVSEHFAGHSTPVTVHSADYSEEHGQGAVDVTFTFDEAECPRGFIIMTVWYEGTELYGEW